MGHVGAALGVGQGTWPLAKDVRRVAPLARTKEGHGTLLSRANQPCTATHGVWREHMGFRGTERTDARSRDAQRLWH